jgi:hypothetical protein
MKKTGILTFHYSNNHGGVLQSYALYDYLKSRNSDAEIINHIPSRYKYDKILRGTGLASRAAPRDILQRIKIRREFGEAICEKFDRFRDTNLRMSAEVDERSITNILGDYETIIVGSDQVWNPSQRRSNIYFLGFNQFFRGTKMSYAADSTVSDIDPKHREKLRRELSDFTAISVRNEHSQEFVERLTGKSVPIVADPTVLCDFNKLHLREKRVISNEKYIFVYVLGKDIEGTNKRAIEKIKQVHGDMPVYGVVDPTREFNVNICCYADEVFYDSDPTEWIELLRNAAFVYTDSFHGTLFSLKFHKPFLAYCAERGRASRFIDLRDRYGIDRFIVSSVAEMGAKRSLEQYPDFNSIDCLVEDHKRTSIEFLHGVLNIV